MTEFKKDQHILAERLLSHIESCRQVDTDGKVSFSSFSFSSYKEVLQDIVDFPHGVPQNELADIVWKALVSTAKEGAISSKSFLRQIEKQEKKFLARQPKRFILVSEISVSPVDILPSFKVAGATISFPKKLPSSFLRSRADVIDRAKHSLHANYPSSYRWVRVAVDSKSDGSAATVALDALHLLLGIWNLSLNPDSRTSWGGARKPVNTIALGPIHTVHLLSGKLERKVWWFDPNYCGSISSITLGQDIERIVKFSQWVRRKIQKAPYKDQLEQWIRLYNRALDEKDWSTSYVRLWQILEAATHTKDGKHQVTVRRVAFLYEDHEFHSAFMNHLRSMRNQLIHESADISSMESHLYLLKNYVETLLVFHLNQAGNFRTLAEISEFLDLPASVVDLRKQLSVRKKALHFREP